jgi:pimeloyl-ACP methyl ester carboxylesterase
MDGPPVLLVHGFGTDHRLTWERSGWTGLLEREGRRWIAPDLLGHGASAKPHQPEAYSVATLLEGLLGAIQDLPGPVDVVGYSLGGELALELAAAHPARVRRVVAGGVGGRRPVTAQEADGILAHVIDGAPLPEGHAATLWSFVTANPENDERSLAACIAGFARSARFPGLASVDVPVFLFAGADDELSSGIEELAASLRDAEVMRIPGRHHGTTLSASRLKRRTLEFLAVRARSGLAGHPG